MRLDERLDAVVTTTNSKMKLGKMQAMRVASYSVRSKMHFISFPHGKGGYLRMGIRTC